MGRQSRCTYPFWVLLLFSFFCVVLYITRGEPNKAVEKDQYPCHVDGNQSDRHSFSQKSSIGRGRCDHLILYTLKLTLHSAVDYQVFAKKENQLSLPSQSSQLAPVPTLAARDRNLPQVSHRDTQNMAELSPYKLFPEQLQGHPTRIQFKTHLTQHC